MLVCNSEDSSGYEGFSKSQYNENIFCITYNTKTFEIASEEYTIYTFRMVSVKESTRGHIMSPGQLPKNSAWLKN